MFRILIYVVALVAAACASTGGGGSAAKGSSNAVTIYYRDYRSGTLLTLVNDSHLIDIGIDGATPDERRVAFYSEKRANPSTKVLEDEVADGVIEAIEKEGFKKYSLAGSEPGSSATASSCLQIQRGKSARHMAFDAQAMDRSQQVAYDESRKLFLGVYNLITSAQAGDPSQLKLDGVKVKPIGSD